MGRHKRNQINKIAVSKHKTRHERKKQQKTHSKRVKSDKDLLNGRLSAEAEEDMATKKVVADNLTSTARTIPNAGFSGQQSTIEDNETSDGSSRSSSDSDEDSVFDANDIQNGLGKDIEKLVERLVAEKVKKLNESDSVDKSEAVSNFFKKKFRFHKQLEWKLPLLNSTFDKRQKNVTVPKLMSIKNQLNHAKNTLNNYPLNVWSKFTTRHDPSSGIAWYLRNEVKAEFVTRAWCKFYECLSTFPIVKISALEFNSVHLCEAPGAFITALNHYLKVNYPKTKFNWCATTLNPYHEGNSCNSPVLDDRLISQTFENWEFGEDFTGNIKNKLNVDQLVTRCRKMGKISLVTADGSVDCSECPNDQENKLFNLHFAEVVAALRVLDMGGSFVLKMFTFFELTTVSLLYFLVNAFDKVDIFKPAASKQGNSEVYIICNGYHRIHENISYVLEMANQMPYIEAPVFALNMIPDDFIEQVNHCAEIFMHSQTKAIQSNIYGFSKPICDHQRIHDFQYEIIREYCRRYHIKSIPDTSKLLYGKALYGQRSSMNIAESGTLSYYDDNDSDLNKNQSEVLMTFVKRLVDKKLNNLAIENFVCPQKGQCICCDYHESREYRGVCHQSDGSG